MLDIYQVFNFIEQKVLCLIGILIYNVYFCIRKYFRKTIKHLYFMIHYLYKVYLHCKSDDKPFVRVTPDFVFPCDYEVKDVESAKRLDEVRSAVRDLSRSFGVLGYSCKIDEYIITEYDLDF